MITWSDNANKDAWFYIPIQEATNSHDYERVGEFNETWTKLNDVFDWATYED